MRRTILLTAAICALLLFLSSCGGPAATNNTANKPANAANNATATAPAANAAAIETEIKTAIDEMSAALSKNDAAAMEKMLTDTYRFVGPDGAIATGPERIASMKSGDTFVSTNRPRFGTPTNVA